MYTVQILLKNNPGGANYTSAPRYIGLSCTIHPTLTCLKKHHAHILHVFFYKWIGNFGAIRQFRLRSASVGGRKHCSHQHYGIARAVYLIEIWQLLRLWQPL